MSNAANGCCDNNAGCCDDKNVRHQLALRITGVILFIACIIEFGVGGSVYSTLTNVKLGAWWGAIVAILTAILSIIAANKGVVVAAITLGSIGALIAVVGASVDGVAAGVINSLVACGGPSGVYGSTTDQAALAFSCNTYLTGNDCSCIDNDYNLCYEYDLANSADTCNIMLTTYPKSLSASCAFCAIIAIICFTISVIGCVEQCCNKEKLVESTTTHNSTDNKA